MKSGDVNGILHISGIENLNDQLILHCGELEEYQDLENIKLILENFDSHKRISIPIDAELWKFKKLVVSDWSGFCKKNKSMLSRGNVNLILSGWKKDISYCYLLGGSKTFHDFSMLINPNEEEQLLHQLCLTKVWVDAEHWVLQWATGKQRLEILANNGVLQQNFLEIESIYTENQKLHISLDKKNDIIGESIVWLAWEEGIGELYHVNGSYDCSTNEVIIEASGLYREKAGKLRIFPVVMNDAELICYYELKSAEIFSKAAKKDKSCRIAAAMILENTNQEMALAASFTSGGYLHFHIAKQRNLFTEMSSPLAKSIKIVNNRICFKCRMAKSKLNLKSISLILRSKVQDKRYEFSFTTKEHGSYVNVVAYLPLEQIEWEQFYWDIRGVVTYSGIESEIRFRNYSKVNRLCMLLKNQQTFVGDGNYVVYPYLTNSYDFAIGYRARTEYDCWQFVFKEYLALVVYYLLRPYWLSRKIWLVYEKYSITAQDNSFYFFEYCMEKLSKEEKKNIYYVIDKEAADYQYVSKYDDHVIQFLSLKHMIYMKAAKLLVSSDTKAHAYAWRSPNTIYRELLKRNKNVFLQHGVIYYKKCHQGLKKRGTNNCRLFIVSSEVEKQIIKEYFGYKDKEIAVTGLARWDVLHDTSVVGEKLILMMPTWRNWLEEVTEEEFQKSDYYKNYMALLNNAKLHSFLERKNVNMIFYIHPKFREYIKVFGSSSSRIKMVEFGTQPLNALIMKCNMMVTDYSSACWDVYYQGKPVLFYLFDYEMYSQVQGSYVDMRTDAFGKATDNADELIDMMERIEESGFREEDKYAAMREELLPYRDNCNSERTYQILKNMFAK